MGYNSPQMLMRKLLTLFIAVFAAISLQAQTSGTCGDNLNWSYNETTKALTITGTGAMTDYAAAADRPWHDWREDIESVSLPEGLTNIGAYAFYRFRALTSVSIPSTVDSIGRYAFYYCDQLPSITLPQNLHKINIYAFGLCSALETITIPNNVTQLPRAVCYSCKGLESISLPEGLLSIGGYAFYQCRKVKNLSIPSTVVSIGNSAFRQMAQLQSISLPDGLTTIDTYTFALDSALTTIQWPANLKSICEYAFNNCISLTSVTLPESVDSVGTRVFSQCSGLTEPVRNSHMLVCMPISTVGEYAIPHGIKTIAPYALYGCTGLTTLTLPETVDSIGLYAFRSTMNSSSLHYINFLSSTPAKKAGSIGGVGTNGKMMIPYGALYAYRSDNDWGIFNQYYKEGYYSNGLYYRLNSDANTAKVNYLSDSAEDQATYVSGSLTIPASLNICGIPYAVNSIGQSAFANCTALTEVTLPASIDTLYARCFKNCTNLTKITMLADHPAYLERYDIYMEHFDGTNSSLILYVPAAIFNTFKQNSQWRTKTIVEDKIRPIEDVELFTVTFYHRSIAYGADYTGDGNEISFSSDCIGYASQKVVSGQPAIEPYPLYAETDHRYPYGVIPEGYSYVGWEEDFSNVTGNMKIHTRYVANPYTVTFKDYDDTVLKEVIFAYGETPYYSQGTPHRDADDDYTYEFFGWYCPSTNYTYQVLPLQILPPVTMDLTFVAVYTPIERQYTITFEDGNGNVLEQRVWPKNMVPVYSGETPTKEGLVFYGWSPELQPATADAIYTPDFRARIIFSDEWGHVWQNSLLELGATPVYSGETPTRAEDAIYTYTFSEWPAVSPATTSTTYTAIFDRTVRKYRIAFFNGEQLLQDEELEYGTRPEYKGEDLTYTAEGVKYNHVGWTPEIHPVIGEQFYYASFSEEPRYLVIFYDCDGITELKKGYVEEGQDAEAPLESQQAGSIITGWDKDFTNVQSALDVYAECETEKYTVSLSAENGSIAVTDENGEPVDISLSVEYGTILTLVATADEGFVFDQWSDAHAENTRHITVTGDITLSALFNVRTLQVVFVDWDDSVLKEAQTVNYGEAAVAPENPTREGYTFTGWDADFSSVKTDLTVKATYESNGSGLEDILGGNVQCTKVLIDGILYILRPDGKVFNAQGVRVR